MKKQILWKDYRLHLLVFIASIIAELIGSVRVPLGRFSFTLAPLIFSMLIMALIYIVPKKPLFSSQSVQNASAMMALTGGMLLAKLGVSSGASIEEVLNSGLAITLQNLGEGFSFILGLPVAVLLFNMGRESIGMSFGVSREANVALISERYGAESPEFRGVMVNYIVGTIFGVIVVSLLMSILSEVSFIRPHSLALATGIGSASMMVGGLGTLIERFPELQTELEAYAAVSNIVSSVIAVYTAIFIGLPLTEWAYKGLSKVKGTGK